MNMGFYPAIRRLTVSCFAAIAACALSGAELKNGAEYKLDGLPAEMTARVKRGGVIRFLLEEKPGGRWTVRNSENECKVTMEHRASAGCVAVTLAKNPSAQAPALLEFGYKGSPERKLRVVLYAVAGEVADFRYPKNRINQRLLAECKARGIELVDWHVHIRGGFTPEMAAERERACGGIRQSAMENHGREWEIYDNARLAAFADAACKANPKMPVGIQVNDRDWYKQIDAATRAKFDYILADTMIMGKLPNGRDKRLWLVKDISEIGDPEKWMNEYVAHNLRILDEPISILANPTYLPAPLNGLAEKLWTEERMKAVISKAVARGIALEVQAESPYPSPRFLKLAKAMGAKFSFGTNNFDGTPKDLSRWLEAIMWLDLKKDDIWTPDCLKR